MTDTIPTLATVDEAEALLRELAESHEWVSVFWDRGWGDSGQTAEITIMVDGNGHDPKAHLTKEVYRHLVDQGIVAGNSYGGYKARRVHDFATPKPVEKTGPTSNEIAEQVIRDLIEDHNDLPIVAEFWRGIRVAKDYSETDAAESGYYVLLIPGHSDVAMSVQEPSILGPRVIGGGIADCLPYPKSGGEVDLAALSGDAFRAELLAAIRSKAALIDAARAA